MIRYVMPWKAAAPGDVTVLRAAPRRRTGQRPLLTKRVTPDGVADYDSASLFEVDAVRLDDIEDIHELLAGLAGDPHACIIRGALKPEFARLPHVLRRSSPRPGYPPRFVEVPRCWLMADLDGVACPAGVDPTDPLLAGGALRRQLPEPFRAARCVAQLSSSAGVKPGVRAHLWFMLDRPLARAELGRWLGAVPHLDVQVFVVVQPHYVAAPIFDGVDDPCPERLALLPGYAVVAVPPLPEPAGRAPQTVTARYPGGSVQAQAYMRGCLRNLVAAPSGKGRSQCTAIAVRLYSLCKAGALDPADVTARIKAAMLARGWSADETTRGTTMADVNRQLEWAWQVASPQGLTP